jgi:hypothetical protein
VLLDCACNIKLRLVAYKRLADWCEVSSENAKKINVMHLSNSAMKKHHHR